LLVTPVSSAHHLGVTYPVIVLSLPQRMINKVLLRRGVLKY